MRTLMSAAVIGGLAAVFVTVAIILVRSVSENITFGLGSVAVLVGVSILVGAFKDRLITLFCRTKRTNLNPGPLEKQYRKPAVRGSEPVVPRVVATRSLPSQDLAMLAPSVRDSPSRSFAFVFGSVLAGSMFAVLWGIQALSPLLPARQIGVSLLAPQTTEEAARILGVLERDLEPVLSPDGTIIGWTIFPWAEIAGLTGYEAFGEPQPGYSLLSEIAITAHMPMGTCVDWQREGGTSPAISGSDGTTIWTGDRYSRTYLPNGGEFTGITATVYWTPCMRP